MTLFAGQERRPGDYLLVPGFLLVVLAGLANYRETQRVGEYVIYQLR